MKQKVIAFLLVTAASGFISVLSAGSLARAAVTLEVLNPRGEVPQTPITAPHARIPDLAGKKVGIYWNHKAGGDFFWDVIEAEMKQKAPAVKIVRFNGPIEVEDAQVASMVKDVDAFFYGVGD